MLPVRLAALLLFCFHTDLYASARKHRCWLKWWIKCSEVIRPTTSPGDPANTQQEHNNSQENGHNLGAVLPIQQKTPLKVLYYNINKSNLWVK
jgi:hypothetical protein